MAIRTPSPTSDLKLTVHLRNGTVIGPADTTQQPFGGSEKIVAIWQNNVIVMYPMDIVEKVEMHFSDDPYSN